MFRRCRRLITFVSVLLAALVGGYPFVQPFLPELALAEGVYASLGTAAASNTGSDGLNFSQGRVLIVDKYGRYVLMAEDGGGNHWWTWSNDQGISWTQGTDPTYFVERAAVTYDPKNDKIHALWAAQSSADGILYRRYNIARDASNNISAITQDDPAQVNLQLDVSSNNTVNRPGIVWVDDGSTYGSVVAVWSKSGSGLSEIRGSMRHLTWTAADGLAAGWQAIDNAPSAFAVEPPRVPANQIYGSSSGVATASIAVRGGSGARSRDLYVLVAESDQAHSLSRLLSYRAAWNVADWSRGWQPPVQVGTVDNYAGGYSLKHQLITKPVLDTLNDRLYVGWARWKDSVAGDTVSIAYLDAGDLPSAPADVYSALGPHSYAPTLDLAYDATTGLIYASYVESTTNGTNGSIDYRTFDGTALGAATRFYTNVNGAAGANGGADIPILFDRRVGDRLIVAFRRNGSLPPSPASPHTIYSGHLDLAPAPMSALAPTPTPSASATSTPTATPMQTATPTSTATASPTSTQTATPTSQPAPAPVAWWKFDEGHGTTVADASGFGNTGSWFGTGAHWSPAGRFAGAGQFNGTDDYVQATDVPNSDAGSQLSVSYWVDPTSLATKQGHVSKYDPGANPTNNTFAVRSQNSSPGELFVFIFGANDSGNNYFQSTSAALVTGSWQHIAFVYDGTAATNSGRLKLYKNGALVSGTYSGTVPASLNNSSAPVAIGRRLDSSAFGQRYYSGLIDDVRIYSQALSPAQIANLASGLNP